MGPFNHRVPSLEAPEYCANVPACRCASCTKHPHAGSFLMLTVLQRVRCWASQAPGHARKGIIVVDLAVHAALHHRLHDHRAEPASFRRRNGRPVALRPAHSKGVANSTPVDVNLTSI